MVEAVEQQVSSENASEFQPEVELEVAQLQSLHPWR
jgi:hypothetical protein